MGDDLDLISREVFETRVAQDGVSGVDTVYDMGTGGSVEYILTYVRFWDRPDLVKKSHVETTQETYYTTD